MIICFLFPCSITLQMRVILDYLSQYESITDDEIMELLNIKRTRAYIIARQMADMGLIDIAGRGKDKKIHPAQIIRHDTIT